MAEKSIGEKRVRSDFNVTEDTTVNSIKYCAAELINLCEEVKDKDPRLAALAQTYFEIGAMLAVKAATAT